MSKRIENLLAQMTLAEKIGQMYQAHGDADEHRELIRHGRVGSFLNLPRESINAFQKIAVEESRLGIPLIIGRDVIHGFRTIFPIPLGQAASFNPAVAERGARIAAREAASCGIHWTFAPMVDITREPRWGRIAESLGEDPVLAGTMGAAMVRGFQGNDLADRDSIAACAKHYVGYGAAEGGRDYNTTLIPESELRNVYLRPFKACVDAGVATVMSAFNDLNGIPASGNVHTLREILKQGMGFDGFVVSDWGSVTEMIMHGYAADDAEAAARAIAAGVDMEMVTKSYLDHAERLIEEGILSMAMIDDAVGRILAVKERLGLFDHPYLETEPDLLTDEALSAAYEAALQSCVLLENDGVLPLAAGVSRLAVIGPLADAGLDQLGCWVADHDPATTKTPLASLRERLAGKADILYVPGLTSPRSTDTSGIVDAVGAAEGADAVVLFLGEDAILSGEAHSRAFLGLPGAQQELLDAVAATGTPVTVVVMAGRPLVLGPVATACNALLYAWHPGTMGGPAIADLLLGNQNPSGKLPVTFPHTVGQIPIYYNKRNTGRPATEANRGIPQGTPLDPKDFTSNYMDADHLPLYPFGYGLSFADFTFGQVTVSSLTVPCGGTVTITCTVENVGQCQGTEVVQLYIRDRVASLTRPIRELKQWQRIVLKPGESTEVCFELSTAELAFTGSDGCCQVEPGVFDIWVGSDSRATSTARITVISGS